MAVSGISGHSCAITATWRHGTTAMVLLAHGNGNASDVRSSRRLPRTDVSLDKIIIFVGNTLLKWQQIYRSKQPNFHIVALLSIVSH